MTNVTTTQTNIHDAFLWVRQVYDEARALLADVHRVAEGVGYAPWETTVTHYATLLKGDFPFVYLYGALFSPAAELENVSGTAIFFVIDFHSEVRKGPHLLLGTAKHSTDDKVAKALNHSARLLGSAGYFETRRPKGDDVIFVHAPAAKYTGYAGVEEIRHAELPLTFIDGQERLRAVFDAVVAMRDGNPKPITALVREARSGKEGS